jgi:hypothetical protein
MVAIQVMNAQGSPYVAFYVIGDFLKLAIDQVPLDYTAPDGEKAAIALIRFPSSVGTTNATFKGPILLNPGKLDENLTEKQRKIQDRQLNNWSTRRPSGWRLWYRNCVQQWSNSSSIYWRRLRLRRVRPTRFVQTVHRV